MPQDEKALIEAFREGDEMAFVSLYNRHKDAIYGFCLKMMQDSATAQDLMQDTFMRVYENRDRLVHTKAFKSWLFTIARNQCLNRLRRDERRKELDPEREAAMPAPGTPAADMEKGEQIALVNQYLKHLKPSYREVIILREYQGLSYKEIAAVTRSSLSAIKSRLYKARRKLASHMRPVMEEEAEAASS